MVDPQNRVNWEGHRRAASATAGLVTGIDWDNGLVQVNAAGVTMTIPWIGPAPWLDDTVRVITAGGVTFCKAAWGSAMGTVQSVANGIVTVTGDDGVTYDWPHTSSEPLPSARVYLNHAGRVVQGTYSTEPPGADDGTVYPAPPPNTGIRMMWFTPIWSGNWSGGTLQSDFAEISANRSAAYGYGTAIADTIPDTATISRAELYLTELWDQDPGTASSMGSHTSDARPASFSNASITGTTSVPGLSVSIAGTIADALKTGSAKGIGFRSGSGWRRYAAAPASGRIYMEWS